MVLARTSRWRCLRCRRLDRRPKHRARRHRTGWGFGGTLYRSSDNGNTWSDVPALNGTSVFDIEFAANGNAYIGTIDSVWESSDGGLTWTPDNLGIGVNDQVFDVALDSSDPSILWAGIGDASGSQPVNVVRSTDGGATWNDRTPPLAEPISCQGIAVDPSDSIQSLPSLAVLSAAARCG